MRPRRWAVFFLAVMFTSLVGMGAAIPGDLPLGLVSAFAFLIGFLGLAFTGLVYLVHWVQFGRRPAYGTPSVTRLGEVVRSDSERRIADYFTSNGIRYQYEKPAMSRWGSQEDKQARLLPAGLRRVRRVLGARQPAEQFGSEQVREDAQGEVGPVSQERDKVRLALPERPPEPRRVVQAQARGGLGEDDFCF